MGKWFFGQRGHRGLRWEAGRGGKGWVGGREGVVGFFFWG